MNSLSYKFPALIVVIMLSCMIFSVAYSSSSTGNPLVVIITIPPTKTPVIVPGSPPPPPTPTPTPTIPVPPPPASIDTPPPSSTGQWCIAKAGASKRELQAGLDYACGLGQANCMEIQEFGKCYIPNNRWSHASYAFNSYYQNNPIPSSCDFKGAATLTKINPSTAICIYPLSPSINSPPPPPYNSSTPRNEPAAAVVPISSVAYVLQPLYAYTVFVPILILL